MGLKKISCMVSEGFQGVSGVSKSFRSYKMNSGKLQGFLGLLREIRERLNRVYKGFQDVLIHFRGFQIISGNFEGIRTVGVWGFRKASKGVFRGFGVRVRGGCSVKTYLCESKPFS